MPPHIKKFGNWIRFLLGLGVLALGASVYLVHRPIDSSHLGRIIQHLFGGFSFHAAGHDTFSAVFPAFAHPFAFVLFTMVLFPAAGRTGRAAICVFWLAIDLFFEIGQYFHQDFALAVRKIIPFDRIAEPVADYFSHGYFDFRDVTAICLGILSAYLIGELTQNKGVRHETKNRISGQDKRLETA